LQAQKTSVESQQEKGWQKESGSAGELVEGIYQKRRGGKERGALDKTKRRGHSFITEGVPF